MSEADDRYNHSPKGRARWCKYAQRVRFEAAAEYLRSGPKSYLDGVLGNRLTKRQKLEAMAAQTASPFEAAIARRMLAAKAFGVPAVGSETAATRCSQEVLGLSA